MRTRKIEDDHLEVILQKYAPILLRRMNVLMETHVQMLTPELKSSTILKNTKQSFALITQIELTNANMEISVLSLINHMNSQ
jgi:hypothetical protein